MAIYKRTNRNWVFWLTMLAIFCLLFYVLRSVLLPFVAGIIIGYLLDPFTTKLQKVGVKNRTLATVLVMLLCFIILLPSLGLLIGMIDEQIGRFLGAVPEYAANFAKRVEPLFIELQDKFPSLDADKVREYIRGNLANSMKLVGSVVKKVVSGGFALVNLLSLLLITPVVAFYMLRDWHSFLGNVDELLPEKYKDTIRNLAHQIDRILAGFIRGQLSVCVLLGTFYAGGLYLVGLELGVLVGFIAGLISFIPYVGSISGFVVSMGIALAQFDTWGPIAQVVAVFMVGQFIEGNFLTPKLVGENVGLHPVWVMFALLAGGVLLGFLGLMIAVPVAAIIGVLIRYAIEQYKESSLYLE